MAPLQKRAWIGLAVGLVFAIALAAFFIVKGDVTTFDDDLGFRLIVYALWIGGLLAYLAVMNLTLRRPEQIDERDRLIMDRAPKVQVSVLIITLIAWTIVPTEVYWDTGAVPVVFISIMFISVQIINTIAQSLGILIGYWRMNQDG